MVNFHKGVYGSFKEPVGEAGRVERSRSHMIGTRTVDLESHLKAGKQSRMIQTPIAFVSVLSSPVSVPEMEVSLPVLLVFCISGQLLSTRGVLHVL